VHGAPLQAMAGPPPKAKMPKHYPTRGLFSNLPVGVAETDVGKAAGPAPDDQDAAGVGSATGEPQAAAAG